MAATATVPPAPANIPCKIEKLNPLAFPKGHSLVCDLTGKPALVSLVTEYTTLHFSSKELAKLAWEGILCKIVHVMGKILAPPSLVGSEEERDRRLAAVHSGKHALIALCREEAASHVVKGQFELARSAWKEEGRERPPRLVTSFWFALGPQPRQQLDDYLLRYLDFMGADAARKLAPMVRTVSAESLRDAARMVEDLGCDELILVPTTADPDELDRVADVLG